MSAARCRICRQPAGSTHTPDCVWEDIVVPSECDCVIEAAVAVVKNRDYARGVAEERARVVAWLRQLDVIGGEPWTAVNGAADAIERGEHEENGNG